MKKPNILSFIEKIAYYILNIFALANLQFLFMGLVKVDSYFLQQYTQISIYFLLFFICIRFFSIGLTAKNLLNRFPDLLFVAIGLFVTGSEKVFQFYLIGRQTFYLFRLISAKGYKGTFFDKFSDNPSVLVLFSFFAAIFVGALLLMLPAATVSGKETSLLNALFTSTSATCVTGLIVFDTGTHFSLFGQLIILSLIQIGGLGIMTISSAFAIMLGQRLSLKSESLIQNVVGESSKLDMISLVKSILFVTIIFEFLGAVILYFTYISEMYAPNKAIYYSIFHSVSAFCNAGFSLYQNSFMGFKSNFNINFVITSLIILGGIGFPVMVDIRKLTTNRFKISRLTLHTKIVLTCTLILLIAGTIAYFISEYNNEMKGFNLSERLYASYFQSVTTRTAGFNTIDTANLSKGSVFTSIILMYIGASPGSTGGGVKTTALIVVFVSVLALFRGNKDVNIFKRKVSDSIIRLVMALVTASLVFVVFMVFLLLLIEPFSFEQIIFEAFSAFGTVGLSMGITSMLSGIGKLIIILLMYLGRVGPLTLIFAISATKLKSNFTYTEEKISIG
jgi:trk system potassium uptake protein TrkH